MHPKTLDDHRTYLHEIVKLMLWFAWHWKRDHPEEPFREVLRNRIDVYRKTDFNKGLRNPGPVDFDAAAEWVALEDTLRGLYRAHADEADASGFEAAAFAAVRPAVDARCRRDFEERPYVLDYKCGSLTYDKPREGQPRRVFFHIANALSPKSIFDDSAYLPRCLMDVMQKAAAEYDVDSLGTQTWLNSHPRWLANFPPQWMENMSPENRAVQWHYGFWGQFITARGTFNEKLGRTMRSTGEFPFWPRASWCTFEALREHLAGVLGEKQKQK